MDLQGGDALNRVLPVDQKEKMYIVVRSLRKNGTKIVCIRIYVIFGNIGLPIEETRCDKVRESAV